MCDMVYHCSVSFNQLTCINLLKEEKKNICIGLKDTSFNFINFSQNILRDFCYRLMPTVSDKKVGTLPLVVIRCMVQADH